MCSEFAELLFQFCCCVFVFVFPSLAMFWRGIALVFATFAFLVCPSYGWRVGSSSIILTPTANGTVDYVTPLSEFDTSSPGTLVLQFDDGVIPIGNGDRESHWVRDHVYASVVALQGANNVTLVVVGADLYMLFGPDIQVFETRLKRAVGEQAYGNLRIMTSATHNHHVSSS